jgi:hypothetical protein
MYSFYVICKIAGMLQHYGLLQHYGFVATKEADCCNIATFDI